MLKPIRVGELEIYQDLRHERLEWKIERFGWLIMALLLLAALIGLLGPGPLSKATAGEQNSHLWVDYNRFERYQSPAMLRVHVGAGTPASGTVSIWLSRDYVENIELHHIDPEPESAEATPDRFIYRFRLSNSQTTAVTFHFEGNTCWRMPVRLGVDGGHPLEFTQVFYPWKERVMESVIRGLMVYFFLLLMFRISGKRTLAENTSFDLVLLLIISETTQEAMVDGDHSITNAFVLIMTLIGATIGLSLLKQRSPTMEKWLDGSAVVIIEDGKMHKDRMHNLRVDEADILEAARSLQGLESLEQIKYAIVERGGQITIVPKKETRESSQMSRWR